MAYTLIRLHLKEQSDLSLHYLYPQHTKYVGVYSFRFSVCLFICSFVCMYVRTFVRSSFRHRVKVFALKFIRPHILKIL